MPDWFRRWEDTGLLAWVDKDGDGKINYTKGKAFLGKKLSFLEERGAHGQRLLKNQPSENDNELYIDRDIMVLANPEIAKLPAWIIALVAAGALTPRPTRRPPLTADAFSLPVRRSPAGLGD